MDGQIGREATPKEYISRLTEVFTEVRRVLRSDGTLWLNISDTYAGKGNQGSYVDAKNPKGRNGQAVALNYKVEGCKPKDMIGIPWMLAFSLRESGWYLRNDIIWMKENPMPESVKDRCARCYEHIFLFSKSRKYFFDYKAISEPIAPGTASRLKRGVKGSNKYGEPIPGQAKQQTILDSLRSKSAAEARRRRRQEMEAQEAAKEAKMLAYMDEVKQEEDEPEPSYPPVQLAPGTVFVDISATKSS